MKYVRPYSDNKHVQSKAKETKQDDQISKILRTVKNQIPQKVNAMQQSYGPDQFKNLNEAVGAVV